MKHFIFCAAVVASLAVNIAAAPRPFPTDISIRVAAESVVNGDQLTLGDIAEVRAGDDETTARLRAINLGYAPGVGTVRELARERIVLALAAAGYNESTLAAPPIAYVRRAAQIIEASRLSKEVERALLAELGADALTIRLTKCDLPPAIEIPTGALEVRVGKSGVRDYFSPFSLSLELLVDRRVVRRLTAATQIEATARVAVASHDIAAGVRLHADDVVFKEIRIEHPLEQYAREVKRLRGVSLRAPLTRDAALTSDMFVSEIVVKSGDVVKIVGDSPRLKVFVAGEARASGRVGDRIQVRNTGSGLLMQATIVDEGEVLVSF